MYRPKYLVYVASAVAADAAMRLLIAGDVQHIFYMFYA